MIKAGIGYNTCTKQLIYLEDISRRQRKIIDSLEWVGSNSNGIIEAQSTLAKEYKVLYNDTSDKLDKANRNSKIKDILIGLLVVAVAVVSI